MGRSDGWWRRELRRLGVALAAGLLPARCIACDELLAAEPDDVAGWLCPPCAVSILPTEAHACPRCGRPQPGRAGGAGRTTPPCGPCRTRPPPFVEARAAFVYGGSLLNWHTAPILQARDFDKVLLVTSAFHMRRAEAVFSEQGINVQPAPTDHKRLVTDTPVPQWLPGSGSLLRTTLALHEITGFWVYRWRGWL